jgi:MinD-like ATPase involved in chromosome partitioning or flagellar assembly
MIVTFYSYKGGVGRTMAVANIGVLLARQGKRVLLVDWDLEAPGLHRYFADYRVADAARGLLDLLLDGKKTLDARWRSYTSSISIDDSTQLTLLTAGKFDEGYEHRVLRFDWNDFFKRMGGGATLESLRREWIDSYDVILIDSRTGITDSGGVCTVQMPDILVPVFSPNRQSLEGTKQVVLRAQRARQELAYDRNRLLVFPLVSRFDSRTEYKESQSWLKMFAEELKEFYDDWVPKDLGVLQIIERTKIPYVAFFSFGEKLPVVIEGTTDPESLGFAYQNSATLMANNFKEVNRLVSPPAIGVSESETPKAAVEQREWLRRIDLALNAGQLSGGPSFNIAAVPNQAVDLPDLPKSKHSKITKLLEHPPAFRESGFDLRIHEPAKLVTGGMARRAVQPQYKLLELWRDGCLIFLAHGVQFLCHDIEKRGDARLRVNTLALTESASGFCELAQKVYLDAVPHPRRVRFLIGFRNLAIDQKNPILKPTETGSADWPGVQSHVAEYGGEIFEFTANPDDDPSITAFKLVAEIYTWFGIDEDEIPYSVERNGQRVIDFSKLRNTR